MGFDIDISYLSMHACMHSKHSNTNVDRWWQFLMSLVLFATMELKADCV